MALIVLDSYALLAFLRGEDSDGTVQALLEQAAESNEPLHMSELNYAEVKCIVIRKEGRVRWNNVANGLPSLPIEFHPISRELANIAADIKARHSLSLADACAAALAKAEHADLITGDPEFKALEGELGIRWL